MPAKNPDLHGSVPESSPVVLLLVDVINDLCFPGGEGLLREALPVARALAKLKERATEAGVPAVYVNDNYGRWQSDFERIVAHAAREGSRGKPVVELPRPAEDDYFVLKPKNSGFYSTTLDTLLDYFDAHTLVLTGIATDNCVLFTANDAYMRDFFLVVPEDCVAAEDRETSERALEQMRKLLKADTTPSERLDFGELAERAGRG